MEVGAYVPEHVSGAWAERKSEQSWPKIDATIPRETLMSEKTINDVLLQGSVAIYLRFNGVVLKLKKI